MANFGQTLSLLLPLLLLVLTQECSASLKISSSSQDGRHPSQMQLQVAMPDKQEVATISLQKNEDFEDMPVTMLDAETSQTFSAKQLSHSAHAHYHDVQSHSVMSVKEVNGDKQFVGHFLHGGQTYLVEPLKLGEGHSVRLANVSAPVAQLQDEFDLENGAAGSVISRKRRQTNTRRTTYIVEIGVLIDSTVYGVFTKLYGRNADTELKFYYTHIMSSIDVAYRNVREVSVSVRSVSFTISKSTHSDRWMLSSRDRYRRDASKILPKISSYKSTLRAQPDHLLAFTRLDIHRNGNTNVIGVAPLSRACTSSGVSINEDGGLHSWIVASHELGHNLGSHHDGHGNGCSPNNVNVMAPSVTFATVSNVRNTARFSSCSGQQFKAYFDRLGSSSCLRRDVARQIRDLAQSGKAGNRYSLDQVCRQDYPELASTGFGRTGSFMKNPAEMCARMYCKMGGGRLSAKGGMRAPIGTPCGERKTCDSDGQCSYDRYGLDRAGWDKFFRSL